MRHCRIPMDFGEHAGASGVEWLKRQFAAGRLDHILIHKRGGSILGASMTYRYGHIHLIVVATLVSSLAAASAGAKDYFLTIGGGPDPSSNQLSLERNVIVQQ